jgi:hypothetical protein
MISQARSEACRGLRYPHMTSVKYQLQQLKYNRFVIRGACMKELDDYRKQLIDKLVASAETFRAACLAVQDPFAPLQPDGWNVHQLATHTRDVNQLVYGLRARRTIEEDNPEFSNFDGNEYIREHYAAHEPLSVPKHWRICCAPFPLKPGRVFRDMKNWATVSRYNCGSSAVSRTSRNIWRP